VLLPDERHIKTGRKAVALAIQEKFAQDRPDLEVMKKCFEIVETGTSGTVAGKSMQAFL